jgi:hypothetical protein
MAEKSATTKKRASARQQVREAVEETEGLLAERAEESKPEEKLQARASQEAVAAADAISSEGIVKSIADLKASVNKTLLQLADRLEEEVVKYAQIKRAVAAKSDELQDIYGIQRSATTLLALVEAQERKREQMERELNDEKTQLQQEIDALRAEQVREQKEHEALEKERDGIEQKKRQRDQEEYRYAFAREQQQARDAFADEKAKAEKTLAAQKAEAERSIQEREKALAGREQELESLSARVAQFPKDLEAAVAKAVAEVRDRMGADAKTREEMLKKEFLGEKNVLTTRVTGLEQTAKEQADRIAKLQLQAEKAYQQVQEIAVRAVEGSAQSKQLASLQQMLTDQGRKPAAER